MWTHVGHNSLFAEGEATVVTIGDHELLICQHGGEFFCLENICTHDDAAIGSGKLENGCVSCPRHGALFDVQSGIVKRLPAMSPLTTYDLEARDGELYVYFTEQ